MPQPVRRLVVVATNAEERDRFREVTRGTVPAPFDEVRFFALDDLRSIVPVDFEAYRLTPDAEVDRRATGATQTLETLLRRRIARGI